MDTIKFEVGKTYTNNFICNADLYFSYKVVRRTDKNVWVKDVDEDEVKRRKIRIHDNVEKISPDGNYSMNPTLRADKEQQNDNNTN